MSENFGRDILRRVPSRWRSVDARGRQDPTIVVARVFQQQKAPPEVKPYRAFKWMRIQFLAGRIERLLRGEPAVHGEDAARYPTAGFRE